MNREGGPVILQPPQRTSASAGRRLLGGEHSEGEHSEVAFDELDARLMRLLLDDGRATNRALAAAAGVTETTVAARIRRLVSNRVMVFTTLFDWEAAGFDWFAIAKFTVERRTPREVAEDVAALQECVGCAVVFGDVDVIAFLLVTDRAELHDVAGARLGAIPGIASFTMDLATRTQVSPLGGQFYLAQQPQAIRLPQPVVDLDDLDAHLLNELLYDGRRSNRKIARKLDVSEGTVRSRITRLIRSGLVRVVAMVEPMALGMVGVVAWVSMRVDRAQIDETAAQIENFPELLLMAVTVGSADISVAVAAQNTIELLDLVVKRLRSLPGVRTTETLQLVDFARFGPHLKRFS